MRIKRLFPKYRRRLPETEISRVESELNVRLPVAYKAALRNNPLAYSRAEEEPEAFCMDADWIVRMNREYREFIPKGMWMESWLWIGQEAGGGAYFLEPGRSEAVHLKYPESMHDTSATDESWPSVAQFLEHRLRADAELEAEWSEPLLSRMLGPILERVSAWLELRRTRQREKRWEQQRRDDIAAAKADAGSNISPEELAGTFRFVTTEPFPGLRSLELTTFWVFYPDGAVRRVSAWKVGEHNSEASEEFGEYRIEGRVITAAFPSAKVQEHSLEIVNANCLYMRPPAKQARGSRVPDCAIMEGV